MSTGSIMKDLVLMQKNQNIYITTPGNFWAK